MYDEILKKLEEIEIELKYIKKRIMSKSLLEKIKKYDINKKNKKNKKK